MVKIFLLDDDDTHNLLNVLLLQSIGLTDVYSCVSVKEAFEYFEQSKASGTLPDLLFVDLNMPGVNGFSFIRDFEASFWKDKPDAKIIMLTNSIMEGEKQEALKFGSVLDFWSKPLSTSKLQNLMQRVEFREA